MFEKLNKIEQLSLEKFCRRHGLDLDVLKNEVMSLTKIDNQRYLSHFKLDDKVKSEFEKLITEKDFWLFLKRPYELMDTRDRKKLIAGLTNIFKELAKLPVDIQKTKERYNKLFEIIERTQIIYLFDLEFNAFTSKVKDLEFPIITICPHLYQVINQVTEIILNGVFYVNEKTNSLDYYQDVRIMENGDNFYIRSSLISAYCWLFGLEYKSKVFRDCFFSENYPNHTGTFLDITTSMKQFVKFHEFSHLFLEHDTDAQSIENEMAADFFALEIIMSEKKDINYLNRYFVGLAILFSILELIEDVFEDEKSFSIFKRIQNIDSKLLGNTVIYDMYRLVQSLIESTNELFKFLYKEERATLNEINLLRKI